MPLHQVGQRAVLAVQEATVLLVVGVVAAAQRTSFEVQQVQVVRMLVPVACSVGVVAFVAQGRSHQQVLVVSQLVS